MFKNIVKYQNRKLYDTDTRQYITVGELLTLPLHSFAVTDHQSKREVTEEVLFNALAGKYSTETKKRVMNYLLEIV